eukprot:TRINITY_DN992_c0_g1_i3.p1 TRINITY_DN992_c0_g1~~TRINITY_DN992_c0_g1_i3.p1  ORF type:complete len:243 (+),score=82.00 TRINITY_DN992_c0_g1_i3:366-1094(+)
MLTPPAQSSGINAEYGGAPVDEPEVKLLKLGVCATTCGDAVVTVHYPCDNARVHRIVDRICLSPSGAPAPPPLPAPLNCSNSVTVRVVVPCTHCTLTQGYWKNHAWPNTKRYDKAWDAFSGGRDAFYQSGQSYLAVMQQPTTGNVYYILADQFIAAALNVGTWPLLQSGYADVDAALADAAAWFSNPGTTPVSATTLPNAQRAQYLADATVLDQFNSGLRGPGHCGESWLPPDAPADAPSPF